jgi:ParB family transcriptional regulator, chromosome partitioning protein
VNNEDFPIEELHEAKWNANCMNEATRDRLRQSVRHFGQVENLVVRRTGDHSYEVLSGNQRLKVLRELGRKSVACLVVDVGDEEAALLSQALNGIHGEDDPVLHADVINRILKTIPVENVLEILPDSAVGLQSLNNLGEVKMADYLAVWQQTRKSRLRHLQFQLTERQLKVVEKAIMCFVGRARSNPGGSPNARGTALYLLCRAYLGKEADNE